MAGLTNAEVLRMLALAEASTNNAHQRGQLFEQLLKYIFEAVPASRVATNVTSFFGAEQIDLAVSNRGAFPALPERFLVECKNYSAPLDSKSVGYFLFICLSRKSDLAVVVASSGLTGNLDELTHAHSLAQTASALGCKLIVITRKDIIALTSEDDLIDLLEERYLLAFANAGIGA
jgi:hypothetical protein